MKRKIFGGAALSALCAVASAQTAPSVTLYGLIDVAVESISNGGTPGINLVRGAPGSNPAAGASQTGVVAGLRHSFRS